MESPPSASWRSGRTAALPYPPLLAYLRYHMSIMGFKSFAKIFQFKFRFMFFKVNSAPKPEFTLQIEEKIFSFSGIGARWKNHPYKKVEGIK